jgi:hypothetical protein
MFNINNATVLNPVTDINVMGMKVTGYNPVYSTSHPLYDEPYGYIGLFVNNFKHCYIDNNILEDVYGDGIYVQNGIYENDDQTQRNNEDGLIEKNILRNCWGLNPTRECNDCECTNPPTCAITCSTISTTGCAFDNYGAGIVVNGLKEILVQRNFIENDISQTGQFGQAGIVF